MSYELTMIVSEHLTCVKLDDIQNAHFPRTNGRRTGVLRYFHTEREDGYGTP